MRSFGSLFTCCILLALSLSQVGAQDGVTCDSYEFQEAAQFVLDDRNADVLDPDGDGIACEELPSRGTDSGNTEPSDDDDDRDSNGSAGADITSREQAYIDGLNDGLLDLGTVSTELGELFTEAGDDPSLFRSEDWVVQVAARFVAIQQIDKDARALRPSDRQQHIQELWIGVNDLTTAAVGDFTAGVDNFDPDSLVTGGDRYTYAALLVNDVIAARDAFNEDPDDPFEAENVIGPVKECDEFRSYEAAQLYYPAHPEEAPTIDPDGDGLACEVFFDREPQSGAAPAQQPAGEQSAQPEAPVQDAAPAEEENTSSGCDPNYSPCIPAYPPDLDCPDIGFTVTVTGGDPHGLDRDNDGAGCE